VLSLRAAAVAAAADREVIVTFLNDERQRYEVHGTVDMQPTLYIRNEFYGLSV
jgi:hypothetical protein